MKYKDVELTSGRTVRVYTPPINKTYAMARKKHRVEKVIVTETTKRGKTISMSIDDDPEYLAKLAIQEELIEDETEELNLLFALKDEKVPDDFNIAEYSEILLYADPEWKARKSAMGRKLDWIEWDLLFAPADRLRVQVTINELLGTDMEVADITKESFPN
jgi:hypothetical protein